MSKQPVRSRPTIYDVAREAGVSKSLVSLVLNGSDLVSVQRREAVLAAIDRLGYRPSRAAATLAAAKSRTVGVLIDDYRNPWFVDLLTGIRQMMEPQGYHLTVADQRASRGDDALDGFLGSRADAIVVAGELEVDHQDLGVPSVVVGYREHGVVNADRVMSDEDAGVNLVLQHLADLGHRRIGHVTGRGGSAGRRLAAYLRGMSELGEQPRYAGVGGETNEEGGYTGTAELLRAHPDLTAVFAANDTMALGARAALKEVGRQVPADVSLVGYDDSLLARARFLDLTTVDNRNEQVGIATGRALLRRLAVPDGPDGRVVVRPELVVRSSTAPVRRALGALPQD